MNTNKIKTTGPICIQEGEHSQAWLSDLGVCITAKITNLFLPTLGFFAEEASFYLQSASLVSEGYDVT